MTFLEIARAAVARGIRVVPLHPKSKAAVERDWQTKSYADEADLLRLAKENPDYQAGGFCGFDGVWIFDVDILEWFMDAFPKELLPDLETFCVKTGGGGRQYYFLHDSLSRHQLTNRSIPNPNRDRYRGRDGVDKPKVADLMANKHQGLLPGCIHPDTGKEYTVYKDLPIVPASDRLLTWLLTQIAKKVAAPGEAKVNSPFLLCGNWKANTKGMLEQVGLKFDKETRDGKDFYNYHALMGKCLVKGSAHEDASNNRQSAFVVDPVAGHMWHQCFSAQCEPGIQSTKKALAVLGADWRTVFASDGRLTIERVPFGSMKKEHIKFLWPGYLPAAKLVHFAGNSTEGKSPVSVDIAARVSSGSPWPDGSQNELGPRKVVLLAAEDDPQDTVLPRLELAGAQLGNVFALKATVTKDMRDSEKAIALDTDMEAVLDAIREIKGLALVIIDPITNYLGRLNMNREDEVRRILMPLSIAAGESGVCLVTVGHLNRRDKGTDPLQRIMGAAAFHGVARFIYFFGPDPEDEDKYAHVMLQKRGVGSPGLKYRTVSKKMEWDGLSSDVVAVEWLGMSEAVGEDIVDPESSKQKGEYKEAAKCLKDFLKSGRKTMQECGQYLKDAGFPISDGIGPGLNGTRVRTLAKAKSERKENKWWWMLKASEAEAPPELGF